MDHKHQTREVAAYNPHPKWPRGYFEVLEEAGVPEKQHAFYAQWVRQFFNAELKGRRRRDLGLQDIERFLGKLQADRAVRKWQTDQAREALILYYEQFRGIALGYSGVKTTQIYTHVLNKGSLGIVSPLNTL